MLHDFTDGDGTPNAVYAPLSSTTNESLFADYNNADLELLERLQTAVVAVPAAEPLRPERLQTEPLQTEPEGLVTLPKKRGRPPLSDEEKASRKKARLELRK